MVQALSEQQRAELTPLQLRLKANDFSLKTMKAQLSQFQRCWPSALCCISCHSGCMCQRLSWHAQRISNLQLVPRRAVNAAA